MTATMRALRLHRARGEEGPEVIAVDEVPVPAPGPGDLLVRVAACGVCGSDLHLIAGRIPAGPRLPQILGHEAAGVVRSVGEGVVTWQPGDRVALQMLRPCGSCRWCRGGRESICPHRSLPGIDSNGAHAEFAVVPARFVVPVPPEVPLEHAALITDAVATPYHAIRRSALVAGMTCAIFGLGGLGMHALLLAKLAGAWVVAVDIAKEALDRAAEWGADAVVDGSGGSPARDIRKMTEGGVDRSFDFVGHPRVADQAVKALTPGGRAVLVGLSPEPLSLLPQTAYVGLELEVHGSVGYARSELVELLALAGSGELDLSRSVGQRWSLEEAPERLASLEDDRNPPVRAVVTFGSA
jgi:alcohol dehydrogenase, propanol-preferring